VFRVALRLAWPAALFMIALVAAACVGTAGAAPTRSPSDKPTNGDQVVFRLGWDGGFVTPETILGRLPIIVVYADGRVVTQGPQIDIYPGPLMANFQEHTLSAAALDRLIELARDKDLLKTIHYDYPGIADAPDTVLEINLDGKSNRVSAYALGEAGMESANDNLLDALTIEGRAALRAFIDALAGIPAADFVDQEHPLDLTAVRIYAGKAVIVPNSELPGEQPAIDWPLENLATAGDAVANSPLDVRCQVIEGDGLTTVLPLLQAANTLSTFRSEASLYSFTVRPLLPGETGC